MFKVGDYVTYTNWGSEDPHTHKGSCWDGILFNPKGYRIIEICGYDILVESKWGNTRGDLRNFRIVKSKKLRNLPEWF